MRSCSNLRLKALIIERFGTQAEASLKFGMNEYRLSRVIHGRVKPTQEERRKIAWALQRRISEVFSGVH